MRSGILLLLLLLLIDHVTACGRGSIYLQNNEYRRMLIAVSEDVEEDDRLVDRIKEAFTAASSYLYQTTRRRSFFKDITILLPSSWTDRPGYEQPISESEDKSDVLIDQPDSSLDHGDRPFTVRTTPCGELGHFIHLSPRYLLDSSLASQFGQYAKTLVHEWAHLRYGVYDEYPDASAGPHFYAGEGGRMEGVRCSSAITGVEWDAGRGVEGCQYRGGMPDADCRFRPDPQSSARPPHGSLMFDSTLEHVTEFCDSDPDNPLTLHNARAPNEHNSQCGERSVWEVLESHGDFERGFNPPRNVSSTVPEFRVVKRSSKRTVLVLDTSGSMSTNDRIGKLAQAATNYLRHVALDGERVGVVWFDQTAHIKIPLVVISNSTREQVVDNIPLAASGGTSIGDGLLKGLEVLSPAGNFTPGGNILVVSDGVETHAPWIRDVIPDLLQVNVTVETVAISSEADRGLEELAVATGGRSFFHPDTGNSNALQDAFVTIATRDTPLIKQTVTLTSLSITLRPGQSLSEEVLVDSTVGGATDLMVGYSQSPPPNLTLVTPEGQVIGSSSPEYSQDSVFKLLTVRLPQVKAGSLRYTVTNTHQTRIQNVTVTLTSRYNADVTSPIVVQASWGRGQVTFPDEHQMLFVSVSKGYAPLLNADVRAVLDRPVSAASNSSSTRNLTLRDNGAGADARKDDGVYSAFVTSFTANGRYNVGVDVREKTTSVVASDRLLGYGAPSNARAARAKRQTSSVEPFRRMTSPGSFSLSGFIPGVDVYAPSKITDLRVGGLEKGAVTLLWTAPGDDFDDGKAKLYRMWMDTDFERLRTNHTQATAVSRDIVLEGLLLDPWPAGGAERVVVAIPDSGDVTYYFTVETEDDAGLVSPRSNIASATLRHLALPSNQLAIVVATSVVGSLVLILAAVAMAIYCHRKRKFKAPERGRGGTYKLEHPTDVVSVRNGSDAVYDNAGVDDVTTYDVAVAERAAYRNDSWTTTCSKPTFF